MGGLLRFWKDTLTSILPRLPCETSFLLHLLTLCLYGCSYSREMLKTGVFGNASRSFGLLYIYIYVCIYIFARSKVSASTSKPKFHTLR